jgi:hypothetical protein
VEGAGDQALLLELPDVAEVDEDDVGPAVRARASSRVSVRTRDLASSTSWRNPFFIFTPSSSRVCASRAAGVVEHRFPEGTAGEGRPPPRARA